MLAFEDFLFDVFKLLVALLLQSLQLFPIRFLAFLCQALLQLAVLSLQGLHPLQYFDHVLLHRQLVLRKAKQGRADDCLDVPPLAIAVTHIVVIDLHARF